MSPKPLSEYSHEELIQTWKNCVKQKYGKQSKFTSAATHKILEINQEWKRRGKRPLNDKGYFEAPKLQEATGCKPKSNAELAERSPLQHYGYSVGENSDLSVLQRHGLLDEFFRAYIPRVFDREYWEKWGEPGTPKRLKAMLQLLVFLYKLHSPRHEMRGSCNDWRQDYHFLMDEIYAKHFNFAFPKAPWD